MNLLKKIQGLTIAIFFLSVVHVNSQELNCSVQVSAQRIQGSNRQVFQTMQRAIYEFMNNTVWTNHVYSYGERIDCSIIFNLTEQLSADEFRGTLQIISRRPVYNTTYNTTMLNFVDNNIQFRYVEFQPLEFDLTMHRSNLVSLLSYYAYLILGFDYDSFSPRGGTEMFEICERIVNNAQNAPEPGWKPYDGSRNRNRYWLVNNVLNREYSNVRDFIYRYHIDGLDRLESSVTEARSGMIETLRLLQDVYRKRPDPFMYYMTIVMEAKKDELINVFSDAFPEEKSRAVQILAEIDPANKSDYEKIQQ
ncbi:MAG: DUF4835 family protein [Bacteroidales bacterium]|jgi:hypothetical protein|nr:DUF4835 family protein [Bacteroidales bacterium]